MKQFLSISFLSLFILQIVGFELIYLYQSNQNLEFETENLDYSQTLTLKLPISLPYQFDSGNPKKVSGTVKKGDDFYQLTEQSMQGDTLYTSMVVDQNAREHFVDLANQFSKILDEDIPQEKHPLKSSLTKSLLKEYFQTSKSYIVHLYNWQNPILQSDFEPTPYHHISSPPETPPKHC